MEFLWYFNGIPVKKAMQKVLLAEFNQYFCGIFHVYSHLAIPQKSGKSPAMSERNWCFDRNFTQPTLLIKTFAKKSQTT